MKIQSQSTLTAGRGADIAFAIAVGASYFAVFTSAPDLGILEIILMVVLGGVYLASGIFGYAYCTRSNSVFFRLIYFCIQIPLGGLIVNLGKGVGYNALILLPLAGHSVVLLSRGWMLVMNAAITTVFILSMYLYTGEWSLWPGLSTFIAGQVLIMFLTQFAANEEKARVEVERLVRRLSAANQRLREYALQVEKLAITKERKRLAREIHDGVGHYLTALHMQIQAARAVMEKDFNRAREGLSEAQKLIQEALADVRYSVSALRVSYGEGVQLPDRVRDLFATNLESIGLDPEFNVLGSPRKLSPQTELAVFRTVQEALSNTCKHAQATKIWVTLDYQEKSKLSLMIMDNGIGTDICDGGFGLLGLKERVDLLNGEFRTTSEKGKGFKINLEVPG